MSHRGAGTSSSRRRLQSFVCGRGARGPAHLLALRHQQRLGKAEGQWCPGRGSWVQLGREVEGALGKEVGLQFSVWSGISRGHNGSSEGGEAKGWGQRSGGTELCGCGTLETRRPLEGGSSKHHNLMDLRITHSTSLCFCVPLTPPTPFLEACAILFLGFLFHFAGITP